MARTNRSICIVGAGAAGLTLARSLVDRGWSVRIVEGGMLKPPAAVEDSYRAETTGIPHRGVHEGRFRALGGSTTRWGGQLWPWEPSEFERRECPPVAGWPIGFDDVATYYDRAFRLLGVPGATLDRDAARARGVVIPPLDVETFVLKFSTWLPWRLRNLGRSLGRPLSKNAGVAIHLGTTATSLVVDARGRVTSVLARDRSGASRRFEADVVVLAGGAIENARLLLASDNPDVSGSAWLGRSFMDHLSVRVGEFQPHDATQFAEMFAPVFIGAIQHTPRIVIRRQVLERECMLGAYGHWNTELAPDSAILVVREKLRALQSGSGFALTRRDVGRIMAGAADAARLARGMLIDRRRYFPRGSRVHLRIDCEQQPDADSRVVLTNELDENGQRRVALHWRVSDAERHTVARATQLIAGELEARGIGRFDPIADVFDERRPWGELRGDSFHMMGGTRMASSASDGVVDTNARVYGTNNLFVAGASIFPTGGMANPTLTLIALAIRLAEHLDGTA